MKSFVVDSPIFVKSSVVNSLTWLLIPREKRLETKIKTSNLQDVDDL